MPRGGAGSILGALVVVLGLGAAPARAEDPDWLSYLNAYRAVAGVSPLDVDPGFSDGALNHAIYVVQNDVLTPSEDPGNAYYTPEGDAAAPNSLQVAYPNISISDVDAIDGWLRSAFYSAPLLNPRLLEVGFGSFRDGASRGYTMAAVIDVLRGETRDDTYARFPITWPSHGATIALTEGFPVQNPDPLPSCPGYSNPTGLPLTIQLRTQVDITAHTLLRDGEPVESCAFDATSYVNPDEDAQTFGRAVMSQWRFGAIVPREPLRVGSTYTVQVTIGSTEYSWSFGVGELSLPSPQTLTGDDSADELTGTDQADVIFLVGGDDTAHGGPGADALFGAAGRDILFGDGEADAMSGGDGGDRVTGGSGNDRINGGNGDDRLRGNGGRDRINGGKGHDTCIADRKRDELVSCERIINERRAH